MEIEYKWNLPDEALAGGLLAHPLVADFVGAAHDVRMRATYFDTADQDIHRMHGGLRLRQENDATVCCLKLPADASGGYRVRKEYEIEAADIASGLAELPGVGAPQDVCELLLASELHPLCETDFSRHRVPLRNPDFEAELAIDVGEMRREGRIAPIHEIELEFVSGSEDTFHAFAARLQEEMGLVVQPLSKLARASSL